MDTTLHNAGQALSSSLSTSQTLKEYVRLTKPRIALLIVISTAVGYCYGVGSRFNFTIFLNALVGTTLLAAGAATLNQWWERQWDAQMKRTKTRPIPAGTVSARNALLFGIALNVLGVMELWISRKARLLVGIDLCAVAGMPGEDQQ